MYDIKSIDEINEQRRKDKQSLSEDRAKFVQPAEFDRIDDASDWHTDDINVDRPVADSDQSGCDCQAPTEELPTLDPTEEYDRIEAWTCDGPGDPDANVEAGQRSESPIYGYLTGLESPPYRKACHICLEENMPRGYPFRPSTTVCCCIRLTPKYGPRRRRRVCGCCVINEGTGSPVNYMNLQYYYAPDLLLPKWRHNVVRKNFERSRKPSKINFRDELLKGTTGSKSETETRVVTRNGTHAKAISSHRCNFRRMNRPRYSRIKGYSRFNTRSRYLNFLPVMRRIKAYGEIDSRYACALIPIIKQIRVRYVTRNAHLPSIRHVRFVSVYMQTRACSRNRLRAKSNDARNMAYSARNMAYDAHDMPYYAGNMLDECANISCSMPNLRATDTCYMADMQGDWHMEYP